MVIFCAIFFKSFTLDDTKIIRDDEFKKDLVVSGARKGGHQGGSVRVVKESDSKSDGLCPHRFESCGPRSFGPGSPTGLLFFTPLVTAQQSLCTIPNGHSKKTLSQEIVYVPTYI